MARSEGVRPPLDEADLLRRVAALEGRTLGEIARTLGGKPIAGTKGGAGSLIEAALGARPARGASVDFPDLGIELKTVPVGPGGYPLESTFVCQCPLMDADRQTWEISWAKRKLSRVLWVPVVRASPGQGLGERTVGRAVLWRPTSEQNDALRADFEEIVGLISMGRIELLTGRVGQWLQARPKAKHSGVRTRTLGPDGEPGAALPRGFYLRRRFTALIFAATPG